MYKFTYLIDDAEYAKLISASSMSEALIAFDKYIEDHGNNIALINIVRVKQ